MNISSAMRILMAWCFSTWASIATVLGTQSFELKGSIFSFNCPQIPWFLLNAYHWIFYHHSCAKDPVEFNRFYLQTSHFWNVIQPNTRGPPWIHPTATSFRRIQIVRSRSSCRCIVKEYLGDLIAEAPLSPQKANIIDMNDTRDLARVTF